MGVNPIAQMGGVSRAKVDCDLCERSEVVAGEYVKGSHNSDRVPNESKARAKVMGMGISSGVSSEANPNIRPWSPAPWSL